MVENKVLQVICLVRSVIIANEPRSELNASLQESLLRFISTIWKLWDALSTYGGCD